MRNDVIEKKDIEKVERQLERSGMFVHGSLSEQANRINEIETFLYSLIDLLIGKQFFEKTELEEMAKKVRDEILQRREHFHAGIAVRVDAAEEKEQGTDIFVNCEERFPVCKGVCCRLNYALSVGEIENGKVKWDLGRPYFIRQEKNGYCSHMDLEKKCCSIYNDRPGVCRKYSCANDRRIWKDFENMVLNQEWIDANLVEQEFRLTEIYMIPDQQVEYKSKVE